jgi:FAD:protein FMN transferase
MQTVTATSCRRSCEAMGTRFEVFLAGEDEGHLDDVAVAVLDEIVRLDGVLSRFDPQSEIARVNREACRAPVRVDREVFGLLEKCEEARRLTEGHFDVAANVGAAGAAALQLGADSHTVRFTHPDASVDLGGVGKGYALDRGREILLRYGVTCGLINGGTSSVLALGAVPGGDGWPVDVRHPLTPEAEAVARVRLVDRALSCSAVRRPGQAESDVVNPLTGRPLAGGEACVVLAASAAEAEIFSTALLAMGRERAMSYLERRRPHGLGVGWFDPLTGFVWLGPV